MRRRGAEGVHEVGEVHVLPHVDQVPVVHAGTPHAVLVDPEAELPDEMKHRGGRRAEPGDVPRVRRNLRLHEHHVEGFPERRGAESRGGVGSPAARDVV